MGRSVIDILNSAGDITHVEALACLPPLSRVAKRAATLYAYLLDGEGATLEGRTQAELDLIVQLSHALSALAEATHG